MKCKIAYTVNEEGFCFALRTEKGESFIARIFPSDLQVESGISVGDGIVERSRKSNCSELLERIWGEGEK